MSFFFLDKSCVYHLVTVIYTYIYWQLLQGYVFNIEAGKQALTNIKPLRLFSNIEVNPRPDEKNEGAIVIEIILKEFEHKSVDVSTAWNIVPGLGGAPSLVLSLIILDFPQQFGNWFRLQIYCWLNREINYISIYSSVSFSQKIHHLQIYCICWRISRIQIIDGKTKHF